MYNQVEVEVEQGRHIMYNIFLVNSLKKCQTEEDVEVVFDKFQKTDLATKIKYLKICRGNPTMTFYAGKSDIQGEYLTDRAMFLTGSWR
jgi:hypothetical protein